MSETNSPALPCLYRVYSNGGSGGPVDYSTPVAITSDLFTEVGPLIPGGDYEFGVRAVDPATGLEEANTDARVRVLLDGTGEDVSGRPEAPRDVVLSRGAGGGCRVTWFQPPSWTDSAPLAFRIYLGSAQAEAGLVAEAPFLPGRLGYSIGLPGPFEPGDYFVEVSAYNARGSGPRSERAWASIGSGAPLLMGPVRVAAF